MYVVLSTILWGGRIGMGCLGCGIGIGFPCLSTVVAWGSLWEFWVIIVAGRESVAILLPIAPWLSAELGVNPEVWN